MRIVTLLISLFTFSVFASTNHEITAKIEPDHHTIAVIDKMTLPQTNCQNTSEFIISLHSDLHPKITAPIGATLVLISTETIDDAHKLNIDHYKLSLPCNTQSVTMEYSGVIFHPITDPDSPYSRGTSETPGLISENGVVISSGTFWYPKFENINDEYISFSLQVEAPQGWMVVSQGQRTLDNRWVEHSPQQDIYLIAAKFTEYEKTLSSGTKVFGFLRTKDDEMASRYLDVTSNYIERYSELIGPYPYSKFALVENFWDTGFGMPSFTLLGSNIIRLPFIIATSYPHEILHDWWGNSVYVDITRGNWCEGITAYMADHLMAELAGSGDSYRRDTLQKFTDFVTPNNDFPLNQFHERNDAASEAIGYGKSLMLFHMLRLQVGDANFKKAFSQFYFKNIFKEVSFREIREAFEVVTGLNLAPIFSQWVDRKGAPNLKISEVTTTPSGEGFLFHAKIEQTQNEDIFSINLPVAIHLEGSATAIQQTFKMSGRTLEINLKFYSRPVWFQVDPEFDTFRRLSKDEVPAVLTMALGSEKTLMVIPANTNENTISNWRKFVDIMRPALPKGSDVQVVLDSELTKLPTDRSIWVLGKENQLSQKFNELVKDQGVKINLDGISINGVATPFVDHSFTLLGRDNNNQIWTFIASDSDASFPVLANKLIHYGKYSYLGFESDNVVNKIKGIWKLLSSSMSVPVVQTDGVAVNRQLGQLTKRSALVTH